MSIALPENSELRILLAITENEDEKQLIDVVMKLGYLNVQTVHSWNEMIQKVKTKAFDVVVSRTKLNDIDIISTVNKSQFFNKHKVPIIFVLRYNLVKGQMALIGNLSARFLHQKTLSQELLEYSIKDIYQQNKTDTLRRENEARYKNLFEHSFDINLIVDEDFNIVEGNAEFYKRIKVELPFVVERLFIYSSTFVRFKEALVSSKDLRGFKVEFLIYNEPANCLIDTFKLRNEDSDIVGYHLVIKDIDTEYKAQQLANRANNLMTTGKFMRSLAHEIRNPLTNIQLAMEQLKEDLMASENSELFFSIMKRSSTRITDLLNKLMNAYKISEVQLKEEDLREIVKRSAFLAQDRIALKEVQLETSFEINPVPVQADFEKLSTAILNLLVNAIEAMEKDEKEITITITNNKKGNVILCIQDNAIGMNQEQLNALFNPFYTGKSKGIGLGLTTTQNIILAHGWEIDVESEVGEGTKFTITIP